MMLSADARRIDGAGGGLAGEADLGDPAVGHERVADDAARARAARDTYSGGHAGLDEDVAEQRAR